MVREAYSQEKNIAAIYQQYENIFRAKLNGRPLSGHYASLKEIREELNAYQPLYVDVEV